MSQAVQSAMVSISRSATIQPKQYNSLSVTVSLSLPILPDEDAKTAIERVDEQVLESLCEKVQFMLKNGRAIVEPEP